MFYRYSQCNTGGFFIGAQFVIVEAATLEEAEARATGAGVYFDGIAAGLDCECCGDRWSRYADEFPTREEAIASTEQWQKPEDGSPVYQLVTRPVG